ncbi:MAG: hypothetical protein ACOH2V_00040 [Candidatus Saccharimonadaceae bacterium]
MSGKIAGINITEPITIDTEVSYDDSINLVISDGINPPKITNSRFYQTSTMTYTIADRKGNLDTNIYKEDLFKVEAGLIKSVRTITTVDFLGIRDGGIMPIGNYTFYFKLADADGNESDFIAESGKVICHIGTVNSPKSIRGGQQDESSYKVIKFKLNNLDLAYDYIHVYYTRSTGDGDSESVQTYQITDNFKITNNDVQLSITGYENHVKIALDTINVQYASFDSVKTLANCQNITFTGNITNNYEIFKTLEKYSLFITPEVVYDTQGIGNLNYLYNETYPDVGYEYYNAKNIYYKLGLWDEEIYRYGIVYIMNNYTLSPMFNIRGRKQIGSSLSSEFTKFKLTDTINYTEDYIIEASDSNNPENVKGVFKIDSYLNLTKAVPVTFDGTNTIKPLGLKFNFTSNVIDGDGKFVLGLKDLTKGFFIVRQRRIPTILAQAVGIATSSKAYIPIIKASKGLLIRSYLAESFLTSTQVGGSAFPKLAPHLFVVPAEHSKNNALLCPEADLRKTTFNTFFNSSEYLLKPFKYKTISEVFSNYETSKNSFVLQGLTKAGIDTTGNLKTELTLVEPGIELIENTNYKFSSQSGDAIIPCKHSDPVLGDYEDPENDEATT